MYPQVPPQPSIQKGQDVDGHRWWPKGLLGAAGIQIKLGDGECRPKQMLTKKNDLSGNKPF